MNRVNPEDHYKLYKDMFHEPITAEIMEGAVPAKDHLLLEIIPPAPEKLSSVNKALVLTAAQQKREPIVFKVLAVGEGCPYSEGDLVCLSFTAGDRFNDSTIVCCKTQDISFKWGAGIKRSGE